MAYLSNLAIALEREIELIEYGDRREELIDRLSRVKSALGNNSDGRGSRTSAVRVEQTVNVAGSVTQIRYTLANGATIQDDYTYGSNSSTEPTSVTFGAILPPANLPTISLSGFTIGSNGTSIQYSAAGGLVTAITGFVTVSGNDYPLTHVSSGAASVATPIYTGATATVTVSITVPGLITTINNAAVANNSNIAAPTQTLNNFVIAANGTSLSYATTGAAITTLTGTVNGIALTHVSSGNATLATAVNQGVAATVTITASTPVLGTAVTGVTVTNNSTVAGGGLTNVPLTFSTTGGASQAGSVLTLAATGNGSIATETINTTLPFELIATIPVLTPAIAMVMYLDNDTSTNYSWTSANPYKLGTYLSPSGQVGVSRIGGANVLTRSLPLAPTKLKLAKSGNNIVASSSQDNGATWIVEHTEVDALVSTPTLYIKALLATGSNKSLDIQLFR